MRIPGSAVAFLALTLAVAPAVGGCGKGGAVAGTGAAPAGPLPGAAVTKNTTRLGDGTANGDAAAVARAVYPGLSAGSRPSAVALVDSGDWRTALAASALAAAPLRLPLLYTDASSVPGVTSDALHAMAPSGSAALGGAQVVSVGGAGAPGGYTVHRVTGGNAPALAAALADLAARAREAKPARVLVVAADAPEAYAMPAAGLAAESGAPILFVRTSGIPAETQAALAALGHPTIYAIGPDAVIPPAVISQLQTLGTVKRIRGADPVANSIAVAQYTDSGFGWGVVDPGHGLVFVGLGAPLDAAAAAPLSASGDYGPILLMRSPHSVDPMLASYLTAIQPGYTSDPRFAPVRGVYNRGWLIGAAASPTTQARLDTLLEISPRSSVPAAPATAP